MSMKFYSEGVNRKYLSIKLGQLFYPTQAPEDKQAQNYTSKITQDSKGNKYNNEGLWFEAIESVIYGVRFYDTQYGTNINIELADGYILSDKIDSRTGTQLMDMLPSIDLSKPVYIKPYDFNGDDGKRVRGILLKQDDVKIEPFFFDKKAKSYPEDFPKAPVAPKNGKISSQAWILYFGNIAMTLREKVQVWSESAKFDNPFTKDIEPTQYPDEETEVTDPILDEADKSLPF